MIAFQCDQEHSSDLSWGAGMSDQVAGWQWLQIKLGREQATRQVSVLDELS